MNVLIVDDEHFVRKGLIHTLPWETYGFQIAGEAEGGAKALAFMESCPVEVLFTDLTMPGMSGMELIRLVRDAYPHVRVVVLTCHQDFAYAQEALQLGVLDYLVKTQMEGARSGETLSRIRERIERENGRVRQSEPLAGTSSGWELLLYPADGASRSSASAIPALASALAEPFGDTGWRIREHGFSAKGEWVRLYLQEQIHTGWLSAFLPADSGETVRLAESDVRAFFHYQVRTDRPTVFECASIRKWIEKRSASARTSSWRASWQSLRWLRSDERFSELLREIETEMPPYEELRQSALRTLSPWRYAKDMAEAADWDRLPSLIKRWPDLRLLLEKLRPFAAAAPFSDDVVVSLYRSLVYMNENLEDGTTQEDAAQQVNLSKGYFGQIFRPAIGMTFHETLTRMRIDKASELLAATSGLVYHIAQQTGFKDEKYFSRVFRQFTGLLPSEYRQRRGGGKK